MSDLCQYNIAVVGTHSAFRFLDRLLRSLSDLDRPPRHVYLGDGGLTYDDVAALRAIGQPLTVIPMPSQYFSTELKTQSSDFRDLIAGRPRFLREVFSQVGEEPVLQLDADTQMLRDEFPDVDLTAPLAITVHDAEAWEHARGKREENYPHCGVVFWNQPTRCLDFLGEWERFTDSGEPHLTHFARDSFDRACKSDAFRQLGAQQVDCAKYNCHKEEWFDSDTTILHFAPTNANEPFSSRIARFGVGDEAETEEERTSGAERTPRVFYFCPDLNLRSGGIARLYRHVRLLNANGIDAVILHSGAGFAVEFESPVRTASLAIPSIQSGDVVVIPEGFPGIIEEVRPYDVRVFGIVLNLHYFVGSMSGEHDWNDIECEGFLSVSSHISEALQWMIGAPVVDVDFGVERRLYFPPTEPKKPQVCFIERKSGEIAMLRNMMRSREAAFSTAIEWYAMEDLSVDEYAKVVRESRIFLNLSTREGLPQSVFEAMAADTLVAGFHGTGGRDILRGSGPEQNGAFVEADDYLALAKVLEPLLTDMIRGDYEGWGPILQRAQDLVAPHTPAGEEASIVETWRAILPGDRGSEERSVLQESTKALGS